jgi:hypothetical protein
MYHRVRQFFRAMLGRVSVGDRAILEDALSPAQAALFRRMARCDQRHGLDVYETLRAAGYQDVALLAAALLHDVGKAAARLTILHRVAVVLLDGFAPGWLARWAGEGKGWKAPFAAHLHHAQIGAAWAQAAGSSADIVALIRQHHISAPQDEQLIALQEADKGN